MRRSHILAATSSAALLLTAAVTGTTGITSASATPSTDGTATSYVVLADQGTSAHDLAARLAATGAKVTSVNQAIGMVVVSSRDTAFRSDAASVDGVDGIAADRSIGYAPTRRPVVEHENLAAARSGQGLADHGPRHHRPAKSDPLDGQLWGMRMIHADQAHAVTMGSHRVRVGIIDTGVQADHPDIHPNFDYARSRNFVTDNPARTSPAPSAPR